MERKIKSCRKSSKKFLEFRKKLGLDTNVVTCDKKDIISALQVAFEGEIILNHEGRNLEYEQSRQFLIESHGITIIRTNPDDADFDINRLINRIYTHIIKSTKKSLIGDLSKRFLELEFKSNHSVKSNCLK